MKIRRKDAIKLAKLIKVKELLRFETIRSTFQYLQDKEPNYSNKKIYGLRLIGQFIDSVCRLNWSKNSYEKNARNFINRFALPCHKEGKYLYVLKSDIRRLKNNTLIGHNDISAFLGIHRSTLTRWLKSRKYRKLPVKREKTLYADKHKLYEWHLLKIAKRLKIK